MYHIFFQPSAGERDLVLPSDDNLIEQTQALLCGFELPATVLVLTCRPSELIDWRSAPRQPVYIFALQVICSDYTSVGRHRMWAGGRRCDFGDAIVVGGCMMWAGGLRSSDNVVICELYQ